MSRPVYDSALEISNVLHALLHQIHACMIRTGSAAAVKYNLLVFGKIVHPQGDQVHGQMGGIGKHAVYNFRLTANIQEVRTFVRRKPAVEFRRIDLSYHVE